MAFSIVVLITADQFGVAIAKDLSVHPPAPSVDRETQRAAPGRTTIMEHIGGVSSS